MDKSNLIKKSTNNINLDGFKIIEYRVLFEIQILNLFSNKLNDSIRANRKLKCL